MSWNYRIVKYKDNKGYGLHEVYYNDRGEAHSMTVEPTSFVAHNWEGAQGVIDSLALALKDARERPVFEEPENWVHE